MGPLSCPNEHLNFLSFASKVSTIDLSSSDNNNGQSKHNNSNFTTFKNAQNETEENHPKKANESLLNLKTLNLSDQLKSTDQEPLIPSFEDWTQLKLQEHQQNANKQDGKGVKGRPESEVENYPKAMRNYASKECGAKIVEANQEAQNPSAVLNEKERDEYLLNPCSIETPKFLVAELCEMVQINRFQLANFELFSSRPKQFRLWSSERYPSPEWHLLGLWTAEDKREIHSFLIDNQFYAKYIKLELLDHYGGEQFCTLTLIRVLGVSVVEEYENEATSAHNNENQPQNPAAIIIPSLEGEQQNSTTPKKTPSANEYFKDATNVVVSVAKGVLNKVFNVKPLNRSSSGVNNSCLAPIPKRFRAKNCFKCRKSGSIQQEPACQYVYLWYNYSRHGFLEPNPKNGTTTIFKTNVNKAKHVLNQVSNLDQVQEIPKAKSDESIPKMETAPGLTNLEEKSMKPNVEPKVSMEPEPVKVAEHIAVKNETNMETNRKNDVMKPVEAKNQSEPDSVKSGGQTGSNNIEVPEKPVATSPGKSGDAVAPPPDHPIPVALPTTTTVTYGSPVLLPGSAGSGKESIFVRINNRLKTLELNISLSSRYLDELSRKYRRQMEDIQRAFNATSRLFSETDSKFAQRLEQQSMDLQTIHRKVNELERRIVSLTQMQASSFHDCPFRSEINFPQSQFSSSQIYWLGLLLISSLFVLLYAITVRRNTTTFETDQLRKLIDESIERHFAQKELQYSAKLKNSYSKLGRTEAEKDSKLDSNENYSIPIETVKQENDETNYSNSNNQFLKVKAKREKRKMSNASTKSCDPSLFTTTTKATVMPNGSINNCANVNKDHHNPRIIIGSRFLNRSRESNTSIIDSKVESRDTYSNPDCKVDRSVDQDWSPTLDEENGSKHEACYFPCLKLANGFKLLESPPFIKVKSGVSRSLK